MTTQVWTEGFHCAGNHASPEDRFVNDPREEYFGIIDGFTVSSEKHPPVLFGQREMTGGQVIGDIATSTLSDFRFKFPNLPTAVKYVDMQILAFKRSKGMRTVNDDSFLFGAAYALVQLDHMNDLVHFMVGADCTIIIEHERYNDIEVLWDEKFQEVEIKRREEIARLIDLPEIHGNKDRTRNTFYPFLCQSQIEDAGIKYSVLIGKPESAGLAITATLSMSNIRTIVIGSDGMFPWDRKPDWPKWSRIIIDSLSDDAQGPYSIREWARDYNKKHKGFNPDPESTMQVVHFKHN